MDELWKPDKICSSILEQNFDDERMCQSEIATQLVEECETNTLTIESLSLAELNYENNTSIIDQSDDESLLSIPPALPNNRKSCSKYWLEILGGSIIFVLVTMIIVAGILFTKDSRTSSVSTKGCNTQSGTGKSCSINGLKTVMLGTLENLSSDKYLPFSFAYTAPSNGAIITFSFAKGLRWYLDDVSIFDSLSNAELIEDGGFESGTLYAYCICDSNFDRTKPPKLDRLSGSYACEIDNFFSAVQLAQAVNTIAGHNYNVSFRLRGERFLSRENRLVIYMSAALNSGEHIASLSLTRFIITFLVFYNT